MSQLPPVNPNIFDRAIDFFAPIYAAKRHRARIMMALTGSYIGASKARRATKEWRTSGGDADADIIGDLPTLRERSRDLARNAPLAIGAISTSLTNIVGTGLKLQSRINRDVLKLPDNQADDFENRAEQEYQLWSESRECDRCRQWPMAIIQELVFRQTMENGDVFISLPRIARGGSPYKLKLQLIEADRVCNESNVTNTEYLIEGVEKDINGAPLRYHILNQHPGSAIYSKNSYTWIKIDAFGENTHLPNIIHLFRPLRPGQTRGVPYLAPVIEPLKQLDRYTETELMAAVISAMFTVFIKTEKGDMPLPAFNVSGMGQETGAKASDTDLKLASGAIIGLNAGESIETANPMRPNTAFEPFVTAILEQIGCALEIPYEIIIRHFSSSYSASRAALLEAWRFFRGRRAWLAAMFCQPIYEVFLYEAIASGRLSAPGYFRDPLIQKAYNGAVWVGDAPGYIDPAKDIEAAEKRINLCVSTLDEETTLLTGGDFDKNFPRIVKERAKLKDSGLWLPPNAKQNQNQGIAQ